MDLTNYPNIEMLANDLGGVKKTIFNKGLTKEAEKRWGLLTGEEKIQINKEADSAVKALTSYVTPSAIMIMNRNEHALLVLPVKDIVWMYTNIEKHTLNYVIPTGKTHTIIIVMRDGSVHSMGYINTPPLSRKDVCSEPLKNIYDVMSKTRKGILVGWSKEICELVNNNFEEAIRIVDSNSK